MISRAAFKGPGFVSHRQASMTGNNMSLIARARLVSPFAKAAVIATKALGKIFEATLMTPQAPRAKLAKYVGSSPDKKVAFSPVACRARAKKAMSPLASLTAVTFGKLHKSAIAFGGRLWAVRPGT